MVLPVQMLAAAGSRVFALAYQTCMNRTLLEDDGSQRLQNHRQDLCIILFTFPFLLFLLCRIHENLFFSTLAFNFLRYFFS